MRFLFVAAFQPIAASGAAGTLLDLGAALTAQGHPVDFEWEPASPARIPHATASRLLELPRRQLDQVTRRLAHSTYDVVIISQPYAYPVYQRLAPRYPRTLFLNRTHGWEARVYDAQRRLGFGPGPGPGAWALSQASAWLTRRACRLTARTSRAVIAPASRCAQYVRETYGLPLDRVALIPYGLDHAGSPRRAPEEGRGPGRRMLFVGNYLPLKGSCVLESLLPQVAVEFPDTSLTVVTGAEWHPLLERRYRAAFRERLTLLGWMERERLNVLYAAHDVLLFPSLFEGFGKVWMEAMASGLCVTGFTEGGLPDVARDDEALLCPPGDVAGLGRLIRRALEDPVRTAAIGRRASERVRGFTWARTARDTVDLCRKLGAP